METLFAEGHRGGAGPLRFVWVGTPTAGFATQNDVQAATPTPPRASAQAPVEPGVSVLFSVPKKIFKRAWKRNLIKRRMRESYRTRKHDLAAAAIAAGQHIDIALICSPPATKVATTSKGASAAKGVPTTTKGVPTTKSASAVKGASAAKGVPAAIPDFKTVDNAIEKILAKILERC